MKASKSTDGKVIIRIDSLLKHIDYVLDNTKDATLNDFNDRDLLQRAICFTLVQIGEKMVKLRDLLEDDYPDVPWKRAIGMRNFLTHDYDSVDLQAVYETVKNDLPKLKELFEEIKKDFE
jgi:uncharacterized protein with HEPN domain